MTSDLTFTLVQYFCVPGFAVVTLLFYVMGRAIAPPKLMRPLRVWLAIGLLFGVLGVLGIFYQLPRPVSGRLLLCQIIPLLVISSFMRQGEKSSPD